MPTTRWDIRLQPQVAEEVVRVRVELGWSPSEGNTCLLVEAQTGAGPEVATLAQTEDCQPMAYEQLIAVPEQPSLALGLVLLAAWARGRRGRY